MDSVDLVAHVYIECFIAIEWSATYLNATIAVPRQ